MYYQTSQGSQVMSYDIFLYLEVAESQDLFRSDANSDRHGLLPQPPNPRTNPDGLPIGLTKTVVTEGRWKGETLGVNCAACHTGQLTYQGKRIRIDGGYGNTFNFMSYVQALDDALQATLNDPAKFDRLAVNLKISDGQAKLDLRQRLEHDAAPVHRYRTRTIATPVEWGPGRLDAITLIGNREVSEQTGIHYNWSTPMAPVKPPFLWNSAQGSWTQWSATVQDPIVRNLGETIGVFLPMDLTSKSPADGMFESAAAVLNLKKLEDTIWGLAPPQWPEDLLGKIDLEKASAGKALFETNCSGCHNMWPYTWTEPNEHGFRAIQVGVVPQEYVGTDPMQFDTVRPFVISGQLKDYVLDPYQGQEVVPLGVLRRTIEANVIDRALKQVTLSEKEEVDLHGLRTLPTPPAPERSYKAAPRDGVWSTPPFLHNGSVPNLYEMLVPAGERTKTFHIGREFDPVRVGVDISSDQGFLFDTSLPGNSNAGHSFQDGPLGNGIIGPLLTDSERWEIVEYLKSIPEEPGRATPFGGTADSVSGDPPWAWPR